MVLAPLADAGQDSFSDPRGDAAWSLGPTPPSAAPAMLPFSAADLVDLQVTDAPDTVRFTFTVADLGALPAAGQGILLVARYDSENLTKMEPGARYGGPERGWSFTVYDGTSLTPVTGDVSGSSVTVIVPATLLHAHRGDYFVPTAYSIEGMVETDSGSMGCPAGCTFDELVGDHFYQNTDGTPLPPPGASVGTSLGPNPAPLSWSESRWWMWPAGIGGLAIITIILGRRMRPPEFHAST